MFTRYIAELHSLWKTLKTKYIYVAGLFTTQDVERHKYSIIDDVLA